VSGPPSVVQLVVDAADAELAADALWQARPSAVLEVDLGDGRIRLTADVSAPERLAPRWAVQVLVVDDDGYLDGWRSWAVPVRAGHRIVVHPAWLPLPAPDAVGATEDLVVVIDPGRAFGSGSHESTRLALAVLEDLVRAGDRVLDVGCGSGVLTVAACGLGAASVTAVDIEPEAVIATRVNAEANGVAARVVASVVDPDRPLAQVEGPFDLVVANIGGGVLPKLAAPLAALVAPGGRLVLSGLLEEQVDAVVAAAEGCEDTGRLAEAGWAAVWLRRVSRVSPPGSS
jgi:ribosomal protein L11 methyltransferase